MSHRVPTQMRGFRADVWLFCSFGWFGREAGVALQERQAERPWGRWLVLDESAGYKVKRIEVEAGKRLSYQAHEHRSEHWVVLDGVAQCTVDGVVSQIGVGQSIDIPAGTKHRLGNPGSGALTIIEVQRGPYTGEDDIIRFEDDYGRDGSVGSPGLCG